MTKAVEDAKPLRIIHVEDSLLDAELLAARLREEADFAFEIEQADSPEAFVAALDHVCPDLILSDYSLPPSDGREVLRIATERCPGIPLIFVSGAIGEDVAIELLRQGATDYVLKNRLERLGPAISRALREARERARLARAESALRESERNYRFITEAMPQLVWTARPDGTVDYMNPRWEEFSGRDLEDLLGGWPSLLHPDDRDSMWDRWRLSVTTGEPYEIQYRFHAADGSYRWFLGRALPMREGGTVIKWFGTCTDIDDQKRIEAERAELYARDQEARRQTEEASRAKDEFLAMVSHELRTPLNSMLGWVRLLRSGRLDGDTFVRGLETIERNVQSQAQLIEDLLDVSRIITGKLRLNVQPVEMAHIVEGAIDSLRPAADAKSIRLQSILDPHAGPVSGDPERLQQVVWNLLSNAIKFTPKGGRVSVALVKVDSHVEVVVSDTGRGIDPAFLPYVFERFRQAEGGSTRKHGGLGLGLAIVRHLVELHGGTVHADSEGAGKGASFTVSLPVMPLRADSISEHAEGLVQVVTTDFTCSPELEGLRILVVDDEPDTREMLAIVLEECRAEVRTAGSVAEALEVFARWQPSVVLSDIGMPGEDGYSLIGKIRAFGTEAGGMVPAVALTAYARYEDRMKALAAGFQMHVAKPIEPSELVMVIRSVTGRIGTP